MAWGDAVIVAPEVLKASRKAVGTGAFTFQNWVQGDRIELSRTRIIGEIGLL